MKVKIVDRELTAEERHHSIYVMRDQAVLGGLASSCGSDTLLIILAMSLGVPASLLACTGQLGLFSFTFLPLGFLQAARYGAIKSISYFTFLIAFLYLPIALASSTFLKAPYGAILLVSVWILLYLVRSSNAAMTFPIQKNITTEEELPGMLARNQVAGMVTGMGSTILITWLLDKYKDNQFFLLPVLFCMAFALYCLCGLNICRVVEPAALKRMTNHKILKQALIAWRQPRIRHQIYVGAAMNLWIAMIPSINIIAMKKCFGFSDSNIMLFGFVQTISVIVASALYKNITLRFGPAKVLIGICPLIWVLSLYWIFIPGEISLWAALPPFILTGAICTTISTGLGNYFSNTVSNVYQVGGTFWVFVITGGLVGLIGMVLNPILFKSVEFVTKTDGITMYRGFFIITAILFAGLIFAPLSLVKREKTTK